MALSWIQPIFLIVLAGCGFVLVRIARSRKLRWALAAVLRFILITALCGVIFFPQEGLAGTGKSQAVFPGAGRRSIQPVGGGGSRGCKAEGISLVG